MSEKSNVSYPCYVSLPDNTLYQVEVTSKCNGQHCLDKICRLLGIVAETDYFGLQYKGNKGELLWLNLKNKLARQIHGSPPYRLLFRVKYFVPPHQLLQEETRHQFYLNVKWHLIRNTWCEALPLDLQAHFLALMAQATYGDYNALTSMSKYPLLWTVIDDEYWNKDKSSRKSSSQRSSLSSHRSSVGSAPGSDDVSDSLAADVAAAIKAVNSSDTNNARLTDANNTGYNTPTSATTAAAGTTLAASEAEDELYRLTRRYHMHEFVGLERSTAEYQFLRLAIAELPAYGTSYYSVRDCFDHHQFLGVGPDSIWITTEDQKVVHRYAFKDVTKISETNRVFFFTVTGESGVPPKELGFQLISQRAATALYRIVTETHCFFCCETVRPDLNNQVVKSVKCAINSLLHDKSGEKTHQDHVFDIRYTSQELYDSARRHFYQSSASLQQQLDADDSVFMPTSTHPLPSSTGHLHHSNSLPHNNYGQHQHHHHHHHHHHSTGGSSHGSPGNHHAPCLQEIGKTHSLDFEPACSPPKEELPAVQEEENSHHSSTREEAEVAINDDSILDVTLTQSATQEMKQQHLEEFNKASSAEVLINGNTSSGSRNSTPPQSGGSRAGSGTGQRRRIRSDSSNSDASTGSGVSSCSVQEEVEHLKAELARHEDSCLCQVCMERELARVFIPCGHLVCCAECSLLVDCCPLCRSNIDRRLPIFLPWKVPLAVGSPGSTSPIPEER